MAKTSEKHGDLAVRILPIKVEEITPERAAQMLAAPHASQRKLSPSWVSVLAERILCGAWDLNAGIIRVAPDGSLVDGQHRCAAIVKAGKPVHSMIATLPWSSFTDDGRRRTVADRNSVSKRMAAVCRLAGRVANIQDPDKALSVFGSDFELSELDTFQHSKPWGCAASLLGAFAADLERRFSSAGQLPDYNGIACLRRLASADPRTQMERRLCVLAAGGKLGTTGAAQMQTAVAVFSAAMNKRLTLDDMRSSLKYML
jgi:hypothetical protein